MCGFVYITREPGKWKCCKMGPMVFHSHPRRLESLTVCRCHYKGSIFISNILRPWVLVRPGFEPTQKTGALPAELTKWQIGEFDKRSKCLPLDNHFTNSHSLFSSLCIDTCKEKIDIGHSWNHSPVQVLDQSWGQSHTPRHTPYLALLHLHLEVWGMKWGRRTTVGLVVQLPSDTSCHPYHWWCW